MKTVISTLLILAATAPAFASVPRFTSLADCKARAIAKHSDLRIGFAASEIEEEEGRYVLAVHEQMAENKLSDDEVDFLMITRKSNALSCQLASDVYESKK